MNKIRFVLKTTALAITLALSAMPSYSANKFEVRQEIAKKHATEKGWHVGIFPGTVDGFDHTVMYDKYVGLFNALSQQTGEIYSFIPERTIKGNKQLAVKKTFPFIYVNAEIAVTAMIAGYTPLVRRNDAIVSVIAVPADSAMTKLEDLSGKKLGITTSYVASLARYSIDKAGLTTKISVVDLGSVDQAGMFSQLDYKTIDAIVVREEVAKKMVAAKKVKILANTGNGLGFVLMARNDVPANVSESLAKAYMSLNPSNPEHADAVMKSEGLASTFVRTSAADLKESQEVFERLHQMFPLAGMILKKEEPKVVAKAPTVATPAAKKEEPKKDEPKKEEPKKDATPVAPAAPAVAPKAAPAAPATPVVAPKAAASAPTEPPKTK